MEMSTPSQVGTSPARGGVRTPSSRDARPSSPAKPPSTPPPVRAVRSALASARNVPPPQIPLTSWLSDSAVADVLRRFDIVAPTWALTEAAAGAAAWLETKQGARALHAEEARIVRSWAAAGAPAGSLLQSTRGVSSGVAAPPVVAAARSAVIAERTRVLLHELAASTDRAAALFWAYVRDARAGHWPAAPVHVEAAASAGLFPPDTACTAAFADGFEAWLRWREAARRLRVLSVERWHAGKAAVAAAARESLAATQLSASALSSSSKRRWIPPPQQQQQPQQQLIPGQQPWGVVDSHDSSSYENGWQQPQQALQQQVPLQQQQEQRQWLAPPTPQWQLASPASADPRTPASAPRARTERVTLSAAAASSAASFTLLGAGRPSLGDGGADDPAASRMGVTLTEAAAYERGVGAAAAAPSPRGELRSAEEAVFLLATGDAREVRAAATRLTLATLQVATPAGVALRARLESFEGIVREEAIAKARTRLGPSVHFSAAAASAAVAEAAAALPPAAARAVAVQMLIEEEVERVGAMLFPLRNQQQQRGRRVAAHPSRSGNAEGRDAHYASAAGPSPGPALAARNLAASAQFRQSRVGGASPWVAPTPIASSAGASESVVGTPRYDPAAAAAALDSSFMSLPSTSGAFAAAAPATPLAATAAAVVAAASAAAAASREGGVILGGGGTEGGGDGEEAHEQHSHNVSSGSLAATLEVGGKEQEEARAPGVDGDTPDVGSSSSNTANDMSGVPPVTDASPPPPLPPEEWAGLPTDGIVLPHDWEQPYFDANAAAAAAASVMAAASGVAPPPAPPHRILSAGVRGGPFPLGSGVPPRNPAPRRWRPPAIVSPPTSARAVARRVVKGAAAVAALASASAGAFEGGSGGGGGGGGGDGGASSLRQHPRSSLRGMGSEGNGASLRDTIALARASAVDSSSHNKANGHSAFPTVVVLSPPRRAPRSSSDVVVILEDAPRAASPDMPTAGIPSSLPTRGDHLSHGAQDALSGYPPQWEEGPDKEERQQQREEGGSFLATIRHSSSVNSETSVSGFRVGRVPPPPVETLETPASSILRGMSSLPEHHTAPALSSHKPMGGAAHYSTSQVPQLRGDGVRAAFADMSVMLEEADTHNRHAAAAVVAASSSTSSAAIEQSLRAQLVAEREATAALHAAARLERDALEAKHAIVEAQLRQQLHQQQQPLAPRAQLAIGEVSVAPTTTATSSVSLHAELAAEVRLARDARLAAEADAEAARRARLAATEAVDRGIAPTQGAAAGAMQEPMVTTEEGDAEWRVPHTSSEPPLRVFVSKEEEEEEEDNATSLAAAAASLKRDFQRLLPRERPSPSATTTMTGDLSPGAERALRSGIERAMPDNEGRMIPSSLEARTFLATTGGGGGSGSSPRQQRLYEQQQQQQVSSATWMPNGPLHRRRSSAAHSRSPVRTGVGAPSPPYTYELNDHHPTIVYATSIAASAAAASASAAAAAAAAAAAVPPPTLSSPPPPPLRHRQRLGKANSTLRPYPPPQSLSGSSPLRSSPSRRAAASPERNSLSAAHVERLRRTAAEASATVNALRVRPSPV